MYSRAPEKCVLLCEYNLVLVLVIKVAHASSHTDPDGNKEPHIKTQWQDPGLLLEVIAPVLVVP